MLSPNLLARACFRSCAKSYPLGSPKSLPLLRFFSSSSSTLPDSPLSLQPASRRRRLQDLAKAYNIAANLKSVEIESRLEKLGVRVPSADDTNATSKAAKWEWIPPPKRDLEEDGSRPLSKKPEWTTEPSRPPPPSPDRERLLIPTVVGQALTALEVSKALTLHGATDVACYSCEELASEGMLFVTGRSTQHIGNLAQLVVRAVRSRRLKVFNPRQPIEGLSHDGWMIVDTGDLIVNLFTAEERARLALEEKWLTLGYEKINVE